MTPRLPPKPEHNTNTLPISHETTSKNVTPFSGSDPPKRPETTGQQLAPTLPSVASLTGYGGPSPLSGGPGDQGSPVSYRPLGVHNMLNPPAEVELPRPMQRVSQSPGRNVSSSFPSHQTPIISPRIRKRKDETSPGRTSQTPLDARQGRRLLTPKSPSLRSMSQGMRGSPSGGSRVSNLQSEGRVYVAEQSEISAGNVPPLPPLGINSHGHYGPVQQPHEQPVSTTHPSQGNPPVAYAINHQGLVGSPDGSSTYGERETSSPFRSGGPDTVPRSSANQAPMVVTDAHGRTVTRSYGAGHPAYQMQISTDQGPVAIPVEIDIQQASKSADEKRKRNAGASARFRQRRKEKELASSQHIDELQRELRLMSEKTDHYRSERNYFRDAVVHHNIQIGPRPPTPQSRSVANSLASVPEPLSSVDYGRRDMMEPSPAQRRRTSDYQPSFAPASLAPTGYPPPPPPFAGAGPPQQQGATVPTGSGPVPPQNLGYALPPPSLPAPIQDPRAQPPPGFVPPHHTQQSVPPPPPPAAAGGLRPPQDPFRREVNPR